MSPDVVCTLGGHLSIHNSLEAFRNRSAVTVQVGSNSALFTLTRHFSTAVTSLVFIGHREDSPRYVFKMLTGAGLWKACGLREMCVYRLLSSKRIDWVPQMLCTNSAMEATLMIHAGETVSTVNLPRDFRAQMEHIYRGMQSLHMRHNDIMKRGLERFNRMFSQQSPNGFLDAGSMLELAVQNGKLKLMDFSFATINGRYSCGCDEVPDEVSRWFRPVNDRAPLILLELLALPNPRQRLKAFANITGEPGLWTAALQPAEYIHDI